MDDALAPSEEFIANIRSGIIQHLRLLADPEAQREFERRVPIADVPAELFCVWFDDFYHPETPVVHAAFSPQEREVLAEFHELFAAVSAEFPSTLPRLHELQIHPAWARVTSGASRALNRILGSAHEASKESR
jgi:hypothetical protein